MLGNTCGHTLKEKNNFGLETGNRLQSPVSVYRSGNSSIQPMVNNTVTPSDMLFFLERESHDNPVLHLLPQLTNVPRVLCGSYPGKDVGSALTFYRVSFHESFLVIFPRLSVRKSGDTLSAWRRVFVTLKSSTHQFTRGAELYCQCLPTV